MSFLRHIDEEFLKIQEFLAVLTDTLPRIEPHSLKDESSLIRALVEQSKAYGKKIINLYESLDSYYKNSAEPSERGHNQSPQFTSRLHQKIQDYEDLIKKLTTENDEFNQQIKQLSKQIEGLHSQYQSQNASRDKPGLNQTPSPINRKASKSGQRDISFELDSMFLNADYNRALETLASNDYKKPPSISFEKFSNWLVIANRIRDSQLSEIQNKLKILITFSDKAEDGEEKDLDDSLDGGQHRTAIDKIYNLLDDKIPKLILQNEYRLEAEKQNQEEYPVSDKKKWATASFKPGSHYGGEGTEELSYEQLKMKVRYLNNNLKELERESREKEIEMDVLRDRLKSARESNLGSPDRLTRENETLFETLENEMKTRFETEARCGEFEQINEELREKLEQILRDFEGAENKIQELEANIKENNQVVSKLVQENNNLREQYEFSEKHEDIEKMKDLILEREQRIKALQEELSIAKEYKVTPREPKRFISDAPSTGRGGQLESQLTQQATIIMSIKRIIIELKSSLSENLGYLNLPIPIETSNTDDDDSGIDNTTEAYRMIKVNNTAVRELNNDIFFIRQAAKSLIAFSVDPKRKTLVSDFQNLVAKITNAEEKLVENLANSLHVLSQTIGFVGDNQSSGITPIELPRVLNLLQTLHDYLNKAIQEFPEFYSDPNIEGRRDRSLENSKTITFQFKEKLIKDQSELTNKLKSTLQSIERKHNDEAMNQLSQEIDKNNELQKKIEAKSLIIHRMNMIYNEGIERSTSSIDQLIKLADSQDAQRLLAFILNEFAQIKLRFKDIIGSSKDARADFQKEVLNLENEYNKQKETWQKMLQETTESAEYNIKRYIKEIEAEREAHHKTTATLRDVEKRAKVIEDLKREVGILNSTITESEKRVADINRSLEEKQTQLLEKEEEGRVMHQKLRKVEIHVDDLTKEVQRYKEKLTLTHDDKEELADELHSLRDKLATSNRANEDLNHEIQRLKDKMTHNTRDTEDLKVNFERIKKENHNLVQELNDVVLNRGKDVDTLQKQLEHTRHELAELKQYKERTENTIKKNSEQIEQLRASYYSEVTNLKDSQTHLSGEKHKLSSEIDKKAQELNRLNQMFDSLQSFSNKQLETLKQKEEKINDLLNDNRELEHAVTELERRVKELVDKNHRQGDSLNQNLHDINTLKAEAQRLIEKHSDNQRDLVDMKRKNEDLQRRIDEVLRKNDDLQGQNQRLLATEQHLLQEKMSLEDRLNKSSDSSSNLRQEINSFKVELMTIKQEYESKLKELETKDREILSLRDILKKERELARESELAAHLKKEVKVKQDEIEQLKKDNQRLVDKIEQLHIEIDTLKATTKIQEQHLREVEKVNGLTQNLSIENESLRKSVKYKEEQYVMEKEAYEREIQLLKKKINDLKSVIDSKEATLNNIPKPLGDSQRSGSSAQLNSSYLNSVIESKDLEIKRLSHIVKNLTENLKDSQEAKFKLKK